MVKPSAQSQAKKGVVYGAGDAEDAALGPAEITAEDIDIKEDPTVTHDGNHGTATTAETAVEGKSGIGKRGRGDAVDDYAFEHIAADGDGSGTDTALPPAPPHLAPADVATTVAAAAPPPPIAAFGTTLQFGIPAATLLAPVLPPPKKKRKTQDEFTISQKLHILNELKGPHAISIPDLAAKHNTSRTSIYRWKKDMPRLQKLARKEGKGAYKRVSAVSKRKNFNEEFTAAEKLAVIRELKGDNAPSVRDLASKVGANYRSLYRWRRDEARLIKLVEQDGKGECKRAGDDPLLRVKEALKMFHAKNYTNPATAGGERRLKTMAVTGTIIATKAKQIRDEMLEQNERTPFLTEEEVKGMKDFTGSTSWGRKIIHKFGWKESSNNDDAGGTDAATAARSAAVFASAPKTEQHTEPPSSVEKPTKGGVKREILLLKKKLHNAIKRANNLEEENAELRAQISLLRNNKNGDGAVGYGSEEPTASGRAKASRLTAGVYEEVKYAAATIGGIDGAAASAFVNALAAEGNGVGTDDEDRHVEL